MTPSGSWDEDDRRNRRHYAHRVQKHGISHKSLDWISEGSQHRRFAVMNEVGDLDESSLLDVGCGTGDFYQWLQDRDLQPEYVGIDITPEMLEVARDRFPGLPFHLRNLWKDDVSDLGSFDYVVCSGIFTYRSHQPFEFLKTMVQRMFSVSNRGVAFNVLSEWGVEKGGDEFHADPDQTIAFCRDLTPWFDLRHDYHEQDFTVFLYHERQY